MKVQLVQATENPIRFAADIASICYGKDEAKKPESLFRDLYTLGHHSVFEHIYYTFKIEGVSRALLAQLTRHRHASFTVRSQRYCEESSFETIIPEAIRNDKRLRDNYNSLMEQISNCYDGLREAGVKREDARMILPNAATTELYMSLNLREFLHIYKLRSDKAAQWEIRDLVELMKDAILEHSPELSIIID